MADHYLQNNNKARLLSLAEKRNIMRMLKTGCSKEIQELYRECIFEKYRLAVLGGSEQLVTTEGKMVVSLHEAGKVIMAHHTALNHANEEETWSKLNEVFDNIPRRVVNEYISKCPECITNVQKQCSENSPRTCRTFSQFAEFSFDNRGHVDVLDMPADESYNFVLHYTIVNSKFSVLRPLKYHSILEVASTLICIFHDFGAPDILQSHSRKYTSDILKDLNKLYPSVFLVNGKYKEEHQKFSLAVKQKLTSWMSTNLCTKWTEGLSYVQWEINNTIHEGFTKTPFETIFSTKPSFGAFSLKTKYKITADMLHEEEVKRLLDHPASEEIKPVVSMCSKRKTKTLSDICNQKKRLSSDTVSKKNPKLPSHLPVSEKITNISCFEGNLRAPRTRIGETSEVVIPRSYIKQEVNYDFECNQSSCENNLNGFPAISDVKVEQNKSLIILEAYSLLTGEHAPPNGITIIP